MKTLKQKREDKASDKKRKRFERTGKVTSINAYKRQVPKNYRNLNNQLVITHEEIAGRCMTSADMMLKQTNGDFLRLWAEPDAIPLCYMIFAYHQNCMIVSDMTMADVIVECYEKDDNVPFIGAKKNARYVALFRTDEGLMPWMEGSYDANKVG